MRTALSLALLLTGCTQPAGGGGEGRASQTIVSTNPCADAILIELVPPERIAAISHYSHQPAASAILPEVARRFPATAGTAEEVIALKPALVLTSSFTPLATRAAYQRMGLKIVVLDSPTTIAASKAQVMQIAEAVGAQARGRALTARIDAAVAASSPSSSSVRFERSRERDPSALLYISGDLATGAGNLLDELLTVASLRNAAADYGLAFTGTLPIETIAAAPPAVILTPDVQSRTAALRRRVLARTGAKTIDARFPRNLVNCGGPTIIPALARLAQIRRVL